MPFRRQRSRGRWAPAAGLVVCCLLAAFAPSSHASPTVAAAAEYYEHASLLLKDLGRVPKLELGKKQYILVAEAFRKVYLTDPASGYCDDSLLAEATLYQQAAERFGEESFLEKALETYRFLVREYPHSKLRTHALEAIRELEGGNGPETAPVELTQDKAAEEKSAPAEAKASQAAEPRVILARHEPQARLRHSGPVRLRSVRFWSQEDYTRVVLEVDAEVPYQFDRLPSPARLYVDLLRTRLDGQFSIRKVHTVPVGDSFIKRIRIAQNRRSAARVVFDLEQPIKQSFQWLSNPVRLVVELRSLAEPTRIAKAPSGPPVKSPQPEAAVANAETPSKIPATALREPEREGTGELHTASGGRPPRFSLDSLSRSETHSAIPSSDPGAAGYAAAIVPVSDPPPVAPGVFEPVRVEQVAALIDPPAFSALERLSAKPAALTPEKQAESRPPAARPPQPQPQEKLVAKLTPPDPPPSVELAEAPKEAKTTSRGKRSLIRALGLKVGRVVIDPGHGGHDTGSIGRGGLREKDLVLDIAMRLGEMIEQKLGATVIYTRTSDRFVPLRERTKLANDSAADLFVSVHANSARARSIRGIETYYLSFTTSSWALAVASRENAAAQRSIHELQNLLSKIALSDKVEESREFATQVQKALYRGLSKDTKGLRNRGVRKAPFMVLVGAKMPAVLAEVGFLSNPNDEKLLKAGSYRRKVAEHLFSGVEEYADSLSKVTVARKQTTNGVD